MKRKRPGFLRRMIDVILTVLTLAAAVGLMCAYIAPGVNPRGVWVFAYAGLAAPVLWMANLFLALYWAIRWRALFFLPALVLMIGMPRVKAFYRLTGGKKSEIVEKSNAVTLLSWNVEGFLSQNASTAREITGLIRELDPDVICMQEFQSTPQVPEATIDAWLTAWPHRKIHYTIGQSYGLALYSKLPILTAEGTTFEGSHNGAIRAELLRAPGDTLRVICNHLQTTSIRDEDIAFLQPDNFVDNPNKSRHLRNIAARLRMGFRKRAVQADTIAGWITARDVPTVVCGDFNDTPMSYSYKTIRGRYGDAFEEAGRGYGYTFKRFYRLLRIDYILHSSGLTAITYDTPNAEWSDHRPVIATLSPIVND